MIHKIYEKNINDYFVFVFENRRFSKEYIIFKNKNKNKNKNKIIFDFHKEEIKLTIKSRKNKNKIQFF